MNKYQEEIHGEQGRTRHGSSRFYQLLEEMAETHDKKSHDYAKDNNPFGNYQFAGQLALLFSHSPNDAGFAGRLAEKIFRLSVLESDGKIPKNESIDDTERDIAVIATLWMASRREERAKSNIIDMNIKEAPAKEPEPIHYSSHPNNILSNLDRVFRGFSEMTDKELCDLRDQVRQTIKSP